MEGLIVNTGKGLSRYRVGFVVFVKLITLDRSDIKVSHDVSEALLSFFLPDLTHCNDVLNFNGFFCYLSLSTWLLLSVHHLCLTIKSWRKLLGFICDIRFKLCFKFQLLWNECSHQNMFCFLKVWLLIEQRLRMSAVPKASEFEMGQREGFYCFKCYLYFLCTK